MFKKIRKRKYRDYKINPDEIFIDTLNISGMNKQQFEGVIEKPISIKNLFATGVIFLIIISFFIVRLFELQVNKGEVFFTKSENNLLRAKPIFAERGVIYDRNGSELAWNIASNKGEDFLHRAYIKESGFGHILGYVNYPKVDSNGNFWRMDIEGQAGLEKKYNETLSGINGSSIFEVNAIGKNLSQNNISESVEGVNLHTTINKDIQHYLYEAIAQQAIDFNFVAGSGGIMDINNGELIALVSYPEYDPYVLAEGRDAEKINNFFESSNKPFLNRAISGLYSPGSIVKPFLAIAALNEGIITENTKILSTGSIDIPNKYNPSNSSIFKDWRSGGHGLTDVKFAIADSVNTFFYAIGGGYKNQEGLGITKIEEYLRAFKISEKTGIDFGVESVGTIPNPEWKEGLYSDGTWRLGDTYITSIGQFGFQVSPIQMLRATSAIANDGVLFEPILVKKNTEEVLVSKNIPKKNYSIVKEGMRDTVKVGTARNINVPFMKFTAKTGTAQVGVNNEFYNSWIIGFFPYENPKYAYTIAMERGNKGDFGSASKAMSTFINSIEENYPEFWKSI